MTRCSTRIRRRLFRSIPLPGADKNARPLVAIPGNFPLPHERPPGCNFGPRCDYFEDGAVTQQAIRCEVRQRPARTSRCLKFKEIDWNAPITVAEQKDKAEIGDVVLKMDKLKKYYEVAANALFGGGEKKVVKANETLVSRRANLRHSPSWANPAAESRLLPRC